MSVKTLTSSGNKLSEFCGKVGTREGVVQKVVENYVSTFLRGFSGTLRLLDFGTEGIRRGR